MDFRLNRWEGYKFYHRQMVLLHDCDPAYPAMRYLADRFEYNTEQRYWLAFLYSLSYSVPTAYYMISEFPDFENVDSRRLESWWQKNKKRCLFQTDRAKVKNFNVVVKAFNSYRSLIRNTQEGTYKSFKGTAFEKYDKIFSYFSNLFYFGRYSLFLLLEAVHELTGLDIEPTGLNLRQAESCRNGVIYATGKDFLILKKVHGVTLPKDVLDPLQTDLKRLYHEIKVENPDIPTTYWNIETTLCAYKKLFWETRYLGYYIDRQQDEILKMQNIEGVDWSVLWDFRREFFHHSLLGELNGWKGTRPKMLHYFMKTGKLAPFIPEVKKYVHSVPFGGQDVYKA